MEKFLYLAIRHVYFNINIDFVLCKNCSFINCHSFVTVDPSNFFFNFNNCQWTTQITVICFTWRLECPKKILTSSYDSDWRKLLQVTNFKKWASHRFQPSQWLEAFAVLVYFFYNNDWMMQRNSGEDHHNLSVALINWINTWIISFTFKALIAS